MYKTLIYHKIHKVKVSQVKNKQRTTLASCVVLYTISTIFVTLTSFIY